MTPREKAEELVNGLLELLYDNGSFSFKKILYNKAKQCALRCCDEVLGNMGSDRGYSFWTSVKEEVSKL